MDKRTALGFAGVTGAAVVLVVAVQATPDPVSAAAPARGATAVQEPRALAATLVGPDVIVGDIHEFDNYGTESGYRAYSIGTTSCNIGDQPLAWVAGTNQHPVIAQSMYRLRNGRFEQIGQSWLKHGFFALAETLCSTECMGPAGSALAPHCSDPYAAFRNGGQALLGPKYQVNATSGDFPYPPANPPWTGTTARRLRVDSTDVLLALNGGAEYWVEAMYVHPVDNAPNGLGGNNASYRKVTLASTGSISSFDGGTVQTFPAILAWQAADPGPTGVRMSKLIVSGEQSTIRVASQAYDNGDGTWRYEYAVHNLNSDRSIGSFTVPVDDGVTLTDVGFHDVEYHSGEIWDGADWTWTHQNDELTWATVSHAVNPNANAIRWATTYSFWFTADGAPLPNVTGRVGLFKAGTPDTINAQMKAPDVALVPQCPGDIGGPDGPPDGGVGFFDLNLLLEDWGPCPGCPADFTGDNVVGFSDLTVLLGEWGPCD